MGEVLGVCGRDPMTAVLRLDSKRGARMLLKHPALTIIGSLALAPAIAIGLVGAKVAGKVLYKRMELEPMNNIVLVHGAFVDGGHWESVYKILKRDGHSISVVQNPTITLEDDVTVTRRVLATQKGPAILVGHSYGGAVITEAGNDPKVTALVYIAAFAPDRGESVATLTKDSPPGAPESPMLPPQDGFLFLDKAKFAASYAADVDPDKAAFWADSQLPWGVECLNGAISEPAWRSKPSWYLVATEDRRIPPDAQRAMAKRAGSTVVEAKGSHAIYFSQPNAVAALIEQAVSKDNGSSVASRE